MRLLALIAGTNDPSNSAALATMFLEGVSETVKDTEIRVIRLQDLKLEHFDLSFYDSTKDQGSAFRDLEAAVLAADGLLLATPIWNFSVPSHLKNLIDRMGSFGLDAESRSIGMLNGKPVYLIYTGGTPMVAWTGLQRRTVSHMSVSLRYFGCAIIGKHYEERCTPGKGEFGLVVDKRPASLEIIKNKGRSFAKIVQHKAVTGRLPLLQRLLLWIFQTGQRIKRWLGL